MLRSLVRPRCVAFFFSVAPLFYLSLCFNRVRREFDTRSVLNDRDVLIRARDCRVLHVRLVPECSSTFFRFASKKRGWGG